MTKNRRVLLLSVFYCTYVSTVSIVYNFRIAQITREAILENGNEPRNSFVALFFDQWREKYTKTHQQYTGAFGSYILDFGSNYFRTDFAVSHIQEKTAGTTSFSGTESDDILFTFGHNIIVSDHSYITVSGFLGIPTHKLFRLQHPDFGYSQIGIGAQVDGSYTINGTSSFVYGARYIHFVPRQGQDISGADYTVTTGNVTDILVANKQNWGKHGLEFGYTARFRFGAYTYPIINDFTEKTDYIRSNVYLVYKYKFAIHDVWNRLLFNISYGRDHRSKQFGNAYIMTFWASWHVWF